MKMNMKELDKL